MFNICFGLLVVALAVSSIDATAKSAVRQYDMPGHEIRVPAALQPGHVPRQFGSRTVIARVCGRAQSYAQAGVCSLQMVTPSGLAVQPLTCFFGSMDCN